MVSFSQPNGLRRQPSLKSLQEDIYRQVQLLLPDEFTFHDALVSGVNGSSALRLEILERHPFTTLMRLTYEFGEQDDRSQIGRINVQLPIPTRIAHQC